MRKRSAIVWVMGVVLCSICSLAMSLTQFNDGGTYNISNTINDDVWVDWQTPGMTTTVNFLDGGGITTWDYQLHAYEDSNVNMSGGTIYDFFAHHRSTVILDSGHISDLDAYDYSLIEVHGGQISGPQIYDDAELRLYGGQLSSVWGRNSSNIEVFGGTILNHLETFHSSQAKVFGGAINNGHLWAFDNSQVDVLGGLIGIVSNADIVATNNSIITLSGSNFVVDGTNFGYGTLTSMLGGDYRDEPHRHLTGTLANGDIIDGDFSIGYNSQIILIPEPATLSLLLLGAGLTARRRKRI